MLQLGYNLFSSTDSCRPQCATTFCNSMWLWSLTCGNELKKNNRNERASNPSIHHSLTAQRSRFMIINSCEFWQLPNKYKYLEEFIKILHVFYDSLIRFGLALSSVFFVLALSSVFDSLSLIISKAKPKWKKCLRLLPLLYRTMLGETTRQLEADVRIYSVVWGNSQLKVTGINKS